jgi:hypothetical protein
MAAMKWEYNIDLLKLPHKDLEFPYDSVITWLDSLGEEGWELVGNPTYAKWEVRATFKRPRD